MPKSDCVTVQRPEIGKCGKTPTQRSSRKIEVVIQPIYVSKKIKGHYETQLTLIIYCLPQRAH